MTTKIDKISPKLISSTPKSGSVAVKTSSNLVLTFDESVKIGVGTIIITDGKDSHRIPITDKTQVSVVGKKIILNPTTDLLAGHHYSVTIPSTAIKDLAGNKYKGITNKTLLSFDTAQAVTTPPKLDAEALKTFNSPFNVDKNIVLTFNQAIKAGRGDIVISNGSDIRRIAISDKSQITFNSKTITINLDDDLLSNSNYTVQFSSNSVKNQAGIAFVNTPLSLNTQDLISPEIVGSNIVSEIQNTDNFTFIFDEKVKLGNGNILIITDDEKNSLSIPVTDGKQVSIVDNVVTINPTVDLKTNTSYTLQLGDGVVQDLVGNRLVSTAFDFKTADITISGKVIDGYLSGSTITITDADGKIDTTSDDKGSFNFPAGTQIGVLTAIGGTDLSTGKAFKGVLKAPAGSLIISPLTTMQQGFIEKGKITAEEAEKLVATAFGFDASKVDLKNYDPIIGLLNAETTNVAADKVAAAKLLAFNIQIANFFVTAGEALQVAAGKNAAGTFNLSTKIAADALLNSLISAIQTDIKTGDGVIDLSDTALLKTVLSQAALLAAENSIGKNDPVFTATIEKITDPLVTIMKDAADNVKQALDKGGSASTLLTNIVKVAAFTQENVSNALQTMATIDVTQFTGDQADKKIAAQTVTPLSGAVSQNDAIAATIQKAADDAKAAAAKAIADKAAADKIIADAAAAKAIADKAAADKIIADAAAAKAIADKAAADKIIADAAAAKAIADKAAADKIIADAATAKVIADKAAADAKAVADAAAAKIIADAKIAADAAAAKILADAKIAADAKAATDAAAAKAITDKAATDAAKILADAKIAADAAAAKAAADAAAAKIAADAAAAKIIADATLAAADTVAPTFSSSSPSDDSTSVPIDSNIVLTFNENVKIGSSNIVITSTSDTRTISVSDTSQVTISGFSVTINPTANLNEGVAYNVTLAAGVIKDLAGNNFAGITTSTALNFTTLITPVGTVNAGTAGNDTINAMQGSVTSNPISFNAGAGNGDDSFIINAVVNADGSISGSNISISGFGSGDKLVFDVASVTTATASTAPLLAALDALYSVSDNGGSVTLTANGGGNVQQIELTGLSSSRSAAGVGDTIDSITELSTFLSAGSISFI